MFHKAFSIAGPLLLAGVAVLTAPSLSQAQHGGGGHGGGGHGGGGGAHFSGGGGHFGGGGAHFGGGGGHISGGYGGYHGGMYHGGGYSHGSHYGNGRYRSYYGGYGFYPYYPYYGLNRGYYPYYNGVLSPPYNSGYFDPYGQLAPDFGYAANPTAPAIGNDRAPYPASTAAAEPATPAHLTVKAPADAQLWFNGVPSTGTGTVRQFESPPLGAGKYIYDVKASWIEDGHDVTETREVAVTAGSSAEVDFPLQPRSSGG